MIRLLSFFALSLVVSIACVAIIKIVVVLMAEVFYHGNYQWSREDIRFVMLRGSIMGLVFCVFGLMRYLREKNDR
ncbi:hypothetical protein BZL54_19675 [Burkholderia ubonensis subsp. mesacidophila]|uniref:Uncharacterized protein n=1 Tax=Burkholderia ubonensis subsp. mesacidophila TaxID=265293 RepID=A0A2A4FDG9_9BURK|nr:hypothetical protein BZL54_19675 [Burkholderia ubonensis subsp. mesacidophila]